MSTKEIGDMGEEKAVEFLRKKGYRILDRNYRCRFGEIDIIAKHRDYFVFIEVKTRKNMGFGSPAEAINQLKINKILKTLNFYLTKNRIYDSNIRIDAVEVYLSDFKDVKINHIENIVC